MTLFAAERVAVGTFHGQQRDDVAGAGAGDVRAVVGVHADDPADAKHAICACVAVLAALDERALVDADVTQLPERLVGDLIDHRHQRRIRIAGQRRLRARIVVVAGEVGAIQRAGQVIADGVQQRLHALVLEGRAHHQRHDFAIDRGLANRPADHLLADRPLFKEQVRHLVAKHAEGVQHFVPGLLSRRGILRRNGLAYDIVPILTLKRNCFHRDQVDHALEALGDAHIQLDRHGVEAELLADIAAHPVRVGADAVHLIDEGDSRHAIAFHLLIDSERLALHAADGAQDHDRSVEHAQRPFDLDREIHVAGGVDQVDAVAPPGDLRGGRLDRDAALTLQVHEVHGRAALPVAVVDLLHPVNPAAIV